jgi:hypothetical protein
MMHDRTAIHQTAAFEPSRDIFRAAMDLKQHIAAARREQFQTIKDNRWSGIAPHGIN